MYIFHVYIYVCVRSLGCTRSIMFLPRPSWFLSVSSTVHPMPNMYLSLARLLNGFMTINHSFYQPFIHFFHCALLFAMANIYNRWHTNAAAEAWPHLDLSSLIFCKNSFVVCYRVSLLAFNFK